MYIDKNIRIKDTKLIKAMKDVGWCEYCGKSIEQLETHHIKSKGSGGNDVRDNLIALCTTCHRTVHDGNISRDELKRIVRERGVLQ